MSDWRSVYAGYDDAALALIGNPGLVRQAVKLLPSARWEDEAVKVGDFVVRLDARGPAQGRCPCPVAGVCVHVLAAAMFVRDGLSGVGETTAPARDDEVVESLAMGAGEAPFDAVLAEVLALSPPTLCRQAGASATRQAYARITGPVPVRLGGDARRLDIGWNEVSVRYIAGAGWAGMVSGGKKKDRPALQLEALARLFVAQGRPWLWPDVVDTAQPANGPTPRTGELTAAVRQEIETAVATGLSHLGQDGAGRVADLVTAARAGGLPLLSRYLGTAAALLDGVAGHRDDISEAGTISALARGWGLAVALDQADAEHWPSLRGTARREYTTGREPLTLLPLGATWWVTDSGARGLTLTVWDLTAGELRNATAARPAGSDPNFLQTRETTALWGVPLSILLAGPFRLDGPRLGVDGTLSATASAVTRLPGGFDETVLRDLAARLVPLPAGAGFTVGGAAVALVAARGFGKIVIDEPQQQLVWSLPLAEGTWQLRQEITPDTVRRVDTLLAWEAEKVNPAYVLARRAVVRGRAVWEPVTLFLRYHSGLRLAVLDFPTPLRATLTSLLQKQWARLRRRWQDSAAVPPLPRSAVARVCDDIRELIVDLAATGRLTPTIEQRRRCYELATCCDDLTLATLAGLTRQMADEPGPRAVLGAQLVADRVAVLAAGYEGDNY